ncbi:MAG: alanine racemase [candidate division Zixibacteria bacterium]|nr:alanine racemase [candidate division Zixibacteria bacterium]
MLHSSYIELSKSALHKNIKFLKKIIGPRILYSSVIKGNAYGHGIKEFVPLAEDCGVRHFSVFSADEALLALTSRQRKSHICIMGSVRDEALDWAIENDISFYVFDNGRLEAAIEASKMVGKKARVHLELETGLNRTGLQSEQFHEAVDIIKHNLDHIQVDGVCTHYAGAESVNNYLRIKNQIQRFNEGCEWLNDQGLDYGMRHTACSAATLTYPESRMDMVRVGIAQYGFWPSRETMMHYVLEHTKNGKKKVHDPLRRVMTWKSRVINVKRVEPGEFIGYGTSYQTTHVQKIASIPIGYHHGFARNLSNLGYVLIKGKRALVVGMVNMHMIMVDVSRIKNVERGEEVVIIGTQKKATITVGSFSDLTRFQNYEVLARLPFNIPRIIVD